MTKTTTKTTTKIPYDGPTSQAPLEEVVNSNVKYQLTRNNYYGLRNEKIINIKGAKDTHAVMTLNTRPKPTITT
jgi:hypothetical protein